jgi:hypothetical protein
MKLNEKKNSMKENENNFETWINIHKSHHVFMKFHGFGSSENIIILHTNHNYGTFKRHLII